MQPDISHVERLKLIQAIIDRMARNSFALKGWAVTLTSALLSLAMLHRSRAVLPIAIYVIITMAILDAYYLALERAYRVLYQRATTESLMSWDLQARKLKLADVANALKSPSIVLLYGLSLMATIIAVILG